MACQSVRHCVASTLFGVPPRPSAWLSSVPRRRKSGPFRSMDQPSPPGASAGALRHRNSYRQSPRHPLLRSGRCKTLAGADLIALRDHPDPLAADAPLRHRHAAAPYHEHNAERQAPKILGALAEGRPVALVSDAGTPLVSDPGYRLVEEVIAVRPSRRPDPGSVGAPYGPRRGGPANGCVPLRRVPAAEGSRATKAAGATRDGPRDAGVLRIPATDGRVAARHGGYPRRGPPLPWWAASQPKPSRRSAGTRSEASPTPSPGEATPRGEVTILVGPPREGGAAGRRGRR